MMKTPRVRFILARRKIEAAIERGHSLKSIYEDLGGRPALGMVYAQFCRYVKRLDIRQPLLARPPTKLSPSPPPITVDPINLASTSYSASISQLGDFTPARKGDAERLFKRAKKTSE